MFKCPKCEKEITHLIANYTEYGWCRVSEFNITDDCNPDESVVKDYRCPDCNAEFSDDEAEEILK